MYVFSCLRRGHCLVEWRWNRRLLDDRCRRRRRGRRPLDLNHNSPVVRLCRHIPYYHVRIEVETIVLDGEIASRPRHQGLRGGDWSEATDARGLVLSFQVDASRPWNVDGVGGQCEEVRAMIGVVPRHFDGLVAITSLSAWTCDDLESCNRRESWVAWTRRRRGSEGVVERMTRRNRCFVGRMADTYFAD